jgi:hypothetical protein
MRVSDRMCVGLIALFGVLTSVACSDATDPQGNEGGG